MLFDPPFLVQQFQTAIAGDAVGQVHDQVAGPQVQEAVDRLAQPAARQPPQLAAVKQFAAGDQQDLVVGQPEPLPQTAQGEVQAARRGHLRGPQDLRQPLDFGLGLRQHEYRVAFAAAIEFLAHLLDLAAEPLDRLDRQMAEDAHPAPSHAGRGHHRPVPQPPHDVGQAVEVLRHASDAGDTRLGLLLDPVRLQDQHGGVGRQVVAEVAPRLALDRRLDAGHLDLLERFQAPLGGHLEAAERFDLIVEELDPHRLVPVRGEDVQDSAAAGELAGQFHGGGAVKAASTSQASSPPTSTRWPTEAAACRPPRTSRVGVGCSRLCTLVTIIGRTATGQPEGSPAAAAPATGVTAGCCLLALWERVG